MMSKQSWNWVRSDNTRKLSKRFLGSVFIRMWKKRSDFYWNVNLNSNADERIRQQTLEWVRINLPYMRVYNYTTSWSDGLTLCFLLQSINPQLCTNATCLKPQNKLQNCELALRVIRDFFQIDTDNIITAEEMVAEHEPDKVLDLILAVRQANESKLKTAFESKRGSLSSMMKRVSFALSLSLKRSNSVQPNDSSPEISDLCTARGSGLHHSIIGRPSAFLVSGKFYESTNCFDRFPLNWIPNWSK